MIRARSALLVLLTLACARERPVQVDNSNLGIAATFPGEAKLLRWEETTPFGRMEWFDTIYAPTARMDESFHIQVGNLPAGTQGGSSPAEVAATFQGWLQARLGPIAATELPAGKGPGFHYTAKGPNGRIIEGVLVIRRARLHHAQATVARSDDPRLRAFIDSFQVQ